MQSKGSNMTTLFILLISLIVPALAQEAFPQVKESRQEFDRRLQWWREARFGMFIHWGPVSLKGTEIGWSRGQEVPIDVYDNLYKEFNPVQFNAEEWVGIAKTTGMKYLVITSKHHDGFCLWDTKTTPYNIMSTPFNRDVVKELAQQCKEQGLRFCTYYSILDWFQPDYNISSRGGPGYSLPQGQFPDMNRYILYLKAQLRELVQNYGPLGVLWFDGEWEEPWTHQDGLDLYNYVRCLQPEIIINNRVDKGREGMEGTSKTDQDYAGDFDTPEQKVGNFQINRPWETCITICRQWAWKPDDEMKSLKECIDILVNTVGGDGNLLLNVGPMPDGRIEPRQVQRLREIGQWLEKYGEGIYGTRGGPFKPGEWGASTCKDNKIYVHVLNWKDQQVTLPDIAYKIVDCRLMHGGPVTMRRTEAKIDLSVPDADRDALDTVIVLELDKPVHVEE
jgi:alpha-L-fucosidase